MSSFLISQSLSRFDLTLTTMKFTGMYGRLDIFSSSCIRLMIKFVFFCTEILNCGLLNHLSLVSLTTVASLFSSFTSASTGYGPPAEFPFHSPLIENYDQVAGKILQRYTLLKLAQKSSYFIHQLPSFLKVYLSFSFKPLWSSQASSSSANLPVHSPWPHGFLILIN